MLIDEQNRSTIDQLVWRLIEECSPQNDDEIKYQAGECLGELGAVDPHAIAFFFPERGVKEPQATKDKFAAVKVAPSLGKDKFCQVSILNFLNSYLMDPDVSVIRISANCLKEILATHSGVDALSLLDKEVQDYLMPYCKKSSGYLFDHSKPELCSSGIKQRKITPVVSQFLLQLLFPKCLNHPNPLALLLRRFGALKTKHFLSG